MKHTMARSAVRRLASSSLVGIGLALAAVDCSSDHDKLARRPGGAGTAGAAGAAGNGGSAGKAGAAGRSGAGGTSAGSGGSGGAKPSEPPGRAVTTLVHGVVDAPRVAWCFARGSQSPKPFGRPSPRRGVDYGGAFTFETLDGIELDDDELSVLVLAGELELVRELDCEDAVALARKEMAAAGATPGEGGAGGEAGAGNVGAAGAAAEAGAGGAGGAEEPGEAGRASDGGQGGVASGHAGEGGSLAGAGGEGGAGGSDEPQLPPPPRLRVATLASFPSGTLSAGYSHLLVAAGCIGGPAFADPEDQRVCGSGYVPRSGNLTANLVVLSRKTAPSALALQALHAAHGARERGVRVKPQVQPALSIADGMAEGTLRPREPRLDLGADDYGVGLSGWTVEVNASGSALFEETWPAILERGGIDELEEGRGYTLVLIGPPDGDAEKWWNAPALTVVDNDPGGE